MSAIEPTPPPGPLRPNEDSPQKKPSWFSRFLQAVSRIFDRNKISSSAIKTPKTPIAHQKQSDTAGNTKQMVASVKTHLPTAGGKSLFGSDERRYEAVKILIPFLEAKEFDTVGLFRTAGNKSVTNSFLERFASNLDPTVEIPHLGTDEVIDALKTVIKEVNFKSAGQKFAEFGARLSENGGKLPTAEEVQDLPLTPTQRNILDEVLRYVVQIAEHSGTNKMDAHNLAIVIAPWFGSKSPDMAQQMRSMEDNPKIVEFFEAIIANNQNHVNTVFKFAG